MLSRNTPEEGERKVSGRERMQQPIGGNNPRILIVEDDVAVATPLLDFLGDFGYHVEHATSWAETRAALERARPDLLILDLFLPDADGLLLCQHLKQTWGIPIIICSAAPHQRDRVLGLKLGADDFVSKPVELFELEARVEAVLRRSNARAQHDATPDRTYTASALTADEQIQREPHAHPPEDVPAEVLSELSDRLARARRDGDTTLPPGLGALTDRESAVLEMIMNGRRNADIGRELKLARRTVESYVTKLFAKTGVQSRWELVEHVRRGDDRLRPLAS